MREVFEGSSSSEDEGGGNSLEEDVCRPRRRGRPSFKVIFSRKRGNNEVFYNNVF